jgi:hypothetical protein
MFTVVMRRGVIWRGWLENELQNSIGNQLGLLEVKNDSVPFR